MNAKEAIALTKKALKEKNEQFEREYFSYILPESIVTKIKETALRGDDCAYIDASEMIVDNFARKKLQDLGYEINLYSNRILIHWRM